MSLIGKVFVPVAKNLQEGEKNREKSRVRQFTETIYKYRRENNDENPEHKA